MAGLVSIHGRRLMLGPQASRELWLDDMLMATGADFRASRYYVDAKNGDDNLAGTSWATALKTMDSAFDKVKSGDEIYFVGKVREQLTSPAGVFDVKIIGCGNRPRHADDHTESAGKRGSSGATWTAPASGSTANALLKVQQQGWRVYGITWQLSGSATSCIELIKTDDSGDDERDGGHFEAIYNKFQGDISTPAGIGIALKGGMGFIGLYNNLIMGFVEGVGVTGATGGQQGWHEYIGNRFDHCSEGVDVALYHSLVKGNYFYAGATVGMDLGSGADNIVTENVFNGDYDLNVPGTSDNWFNNYSLDTASGEVDADGKTSAVPAA